MARNFAAGTNVLRNASALGITGYPVAFSCFFRVPNVSGYKPIMALNDVGASGSLILSVNGNVLLNQTTNDSAIGESVTSSNTISIDTWYHAMAMWYSATERYVVLNDVCVAGTSTNLVFPAALDRFSVGGEERFSAQQFVGDLYRATVWKDVKPLLDTVKAISNGKPPYFVHHENMVAHYALNNANGTNEQDLINTNHLTLTGSSNYVSTNPTLLTKLTRRTASRLNRGAA